MIVFSYYLKILKQYTGLIIMYIAIFTLFSVVFTIYNKENVSFAANKPNVAIINNENSKFIDSFLDYIKTTSNIVEIKNEDLKDALFYRRVDLILTIPFNFTSDFFNGKNPKINMQRIPDSYNSTYALMYLNRYLNIANLYNTNNISEDNLIKYIESDLKLETEIIMAYKSSTKLSDANYFYNFSNYSILAISVTIVGMIMSSFRNNNIKRRNLISPISYSKQNNSLFLGNLFVAIGIWLLFVILGMCFFSSALFSLNGFFLSINVLIFSLTTVSMGFLIGNVIYNKEAISSIVNVVALGSSFICGAFVPQEILGDSVLKIAKYFPSYWFVKSNNEIVILNNFNLSKLMPIMTNMLVVILFGLLFFILNKLIMKFKLKEN